MLKTADMEVAERMMGKPLKNAIIDLYAEHQSLDKVAELLAVRRQTLYNWRLRLQITEVELKMAALERTIEREALDA